MNLKKLYQNIIGKKETISKIEEHPKFIEYLEKGWLEPAFENNQPVIVEGMQLYQVVNAEESVRMSRIFKFNHLMAQAENFGMTKESINFNRKIQKGLRQRIRDSRNNPDEVLQLIEEMDLNDYAFDEVQKVGMDDELIFSVAAVWYILPCEDPSNFVESFWLKKIEMFRKAELSVFFYTAGLRILAASLQAFVEDFQNFMEMVMNSNLQSIKLMQLNLQRYLSSISNTLNEEEYGLLVKQLETLNERKAFLNVQLLRSTSSY